ncbi:MAG TPA: hypothetical protein VG894_12035 [Bauldia sp.]|nr:hypothetical protein [Bauldia sp.]
MAANVDGLIAEIAARTKLDVPVARRAIGTIANFVASEAPAAAADALFAKIPGAAALAQEYQQPSGGLFGIFNALMASGISVADMPTITSSFVSFAKANGAEREVNDVINSIPGLAQFV